MANNNDDFVTNFILLGGKTKFCFILEKYTMLKWEIMKKVSSGHDLYYDLFCCVEVGQILLPFVAANGHFGTSRLCPLRSPMGITAHFYQFNSIAFRR